MRCVHSQSRSRPHRMSRYHAPLLAPLTLLLLAACAPQPAAVWPAAEHTVFVIHQGDSVIATERTTRTLDRLEGEISMPGQARAQYVAELTGPGFVRTLRATISAWSGPARETLTVDLAEDSLVVRSTRWNELPQTFRPAAAAVYLHPSPALLEILLRRALITGDSAPEVRVWLANQNTPATARFTPVEGRVRIDFAGTRVYVVHENGTLIMGEVPALGWVFSRQPPEGGPVN